MKSYKSPQQSAVENEDRNKSLDVVMHGRCDIRTDLLPLDERKRIRRPMAWDAASYFAAEFPGHRWLAMFVDLWKAAFQEREVVSIDDVLYRSGREPIQIFSEVRVSDWPSTEQDHGPELTLTESNCSSGSLGTLIRDALPNRNPTLQGREDCMAWKTANMYLELSRKDQPEGEFETSGLAKSKAELWCHEIFHRAWVITDRAELLEEARRYGLDVNTNEQQEWDSNSRPSRGKRLKIADVLLKRY